MKGGPSVEVLLDLALGDNPEVAEVGGSEILKTQVFLYEADTDRLEQAYKAGNTLVKRYSRKLRQGGVLYPTA